MKNKKGFTLVELIGVLVILVVIFLIGIPALTALIKSAEGDIDSASREMVYDATKDYLASKQEMYVQKEGNTYCIGLEEIVNNGNLTDTQLKTIGEDYKIVKVTYEQNKNVTYEIVGDDCKKVEKNARIEIAGKKTITLKLVDDGSKKEFVDDGFIYYADGENSTSIPVDVNVYVNQPSNLKISTSSVKTKDVLTCSASINCLPQTVVDTYVMKYEYTNEDGKTFYAERTVKIIDDEPPVITLDEEEVTIPVNTKNFDIKAGVTVTDNSGEIPELKATSNLILGKPGSYTINYTATDSSGNTSTKTKKVNVEMPQTEIHFDIKNPNETYEINSITYDKARVLNEVYTYDQLGIGYNEKITYTIRKNSMNVSKVDTSSLGTYIITYNIVQNGITYSGIRTVNIVDTTKPDITFTDDPVFVYPDKTYPDVLDGVIVSDNSKENIQAVPSSSSLTFPNGNTQTITYTATDSSGNKATKTRTFNRYDTPGLPVLSGGSNLWKSGSVNLTISTKATAAEGISHYEYYYSTAPNVQVNGEWKTMNENDTLTVSKEGTTYVYVRGVSSKGVKGTISAYATVKIDLTNPSVTAAVSGKKVTLTLNDNVGIASYGVGKSNTTAPTFIDSTNKTQEWDAAEPGTYYAWVKDSSGRTGVSAAIVVPESAFNYPAVSSSSTYAATLSCSGGRTLSGTNCTYYYSANADKCGSTARDCNCWPDWYDCNCTDVCVGGNESYTYTDTCYNKVCSTWFYDKCDENCLRKPQGSQATCCATKECTKYTNSPYSCTKTGTRYNACLSTTQSCGRCGAGCNTCYDAKSCTVTENEYKTYSCNAGDTLSGTTCTHIAYTCPNGGTLSGTTCVR